MKSIGGNSLVIKEININLVKKALKIEKYATKQEIAKVTGLSIVTVGTVLQYLVKENEVIETELISSKGGRPAQQYKYNEDFNLVLVIFPYDKDDKSIVSVSVVNLGGNCIYEKEHRVKVVNITVLEDIIKPILDEYKLIKSIGFGNPGVEIDGEIIHSDYWMLKGVNIIEYFSNLYGIKAVIENDVNAAVIGFSDSNNLKDKGTFVYLYFPDKYPPGAGIFINGKIFKGGRNFAGEVATMPLGITWNKELYDTFEDFCEAVSKLIVSVCSILNPDEIIMNGTFISDKHIELINGKCERKLTKNILPKFSLSNNFLDDYKKGLIVEALSVLEPDVTLIKNK